MEKSTKEEMDKSKVLSTGLSLDQSFNTQKQQNTSLFAGCADELSRVDERSEF